MRASFRHVVPLLLAAAGLMLLVSSSGQSSPAAAVDIEQYPYRAVVPNIGKSDGVYNPATATPSSPSGLSFFQVNFIDVGQGDATLIIAGGQRLLVDGGRSQSLIRDRLEEMGITDIDAIVATHSDADHIAGLIEALEMFAVERIYLNGDESDSQTYDDFMAAVDAEGASVTTVSRGMTVALGGLDIEVVHPPSITGDLNEDSVVLTWQCGEVGVSLMGDATIASEQAMLAAGVAYDIDVLKVGHHGSDTSTSQAFLDATTPSYAVVSAGRDSQFGHPHEEVIERVLGMGATIYHTDTTTGNDTVVMGSDCATVEFNAEPWTPPGSTPTTVPTIPVIPTVPQVPIATATSAPSLPACAQGGDDCNCSDFATWGQAQTFHNVHDPLDEHGLDGDSDGDVCESLPGYPG